MVQEIQDSHYWVSLESMLEFLKYKGETVDKQYLKTGIENTIKEGYGLARIDKKPNVETRISSIPESKL